MSLHASSLARATPWLFALCSAFAQAAPPAAPSQPVSDVHHGVAVPDPFRNLEDVNHPATRGWMQAQGAYAAQQLARIAGRDELAQRIDALGRESGDRVSAVLRMPGGRLYYLLRKAGEPQAKLVMREGLAAEPRVLVDPTAQMRATGVPHAINYFRPSWDGRTLAYGVSAGGSEDASLHVMDIASGRLLAPPIARVHEVDLSWSPDSRFLAFNRFRELPAGAPETETYLDSSVYLFDRQRPAAAPRAVFGPLVNRGLGLERLDVGDLVFTPGSRHVIARTTDTTIPDAKLFVAPLAALLRGGDAARVPWRAIAHTRDRISQFAVRGDMLYARTVTGAPGGRVLALDLRRPDLARARVVVPEPPSGVVERVAVAGDSLLVQVRQAFTVRQWRVDPRRGGAGADVAPAEAGSMFLVAAPAQDEREAWFTTSRWTEPSRVLAVDVRGRVRDTGLLRSAMPAGAPPLEAFEVMVPSHDGVQVPLAVVHAKGLPRDGARPTLLVGYGAYGLSMSAGFDTRSIAWLERGGVIAYANVRGSGALGDAWYKAGFQATKPNTWKDGIACARWLIEQRFATPATLAVMGGSAGGIFAGRAMTSEPSLFAAAVIQVGSLDTVRSEHTANGITNISEFGSVRDPDGFRALLEMSTYHQIRDGVRYPAVLLTHGMNDPRVEVWQSAKAAARLQQANPDGKPVLLRLDAQAGHGIGSTAAQRSAQLADVYAFMLWQMGKAAARAD
ncbi:MAG TPA: prolyl oligopeptidase family serine peptidase [Burkholderiaceae bacterium]|nr:prolyl oligopeptidase family serine peptidase [Burkholderiaceae bacterium]